MPAATYDFSIANASHIEQGATFDVTLTWLDDADAPIDLTGYTARMQIRQTIGAVTTLAELTTENDKIVLGDEDGTIRLLLADEETEDYVWTNPAVYDLELVSPAGVVTRLFKGKVELDPEVTR